jgi:hypothetical protein
LEFALGRPYSLRQEKSSEAFDFRSIWDEAALKRPMILVGSRKIPGRSIARKIRCFGEKIRCSEEKNSLTVCTGNGAVMAQDLGILCLF